MQRLLRFPSIEQFRTVVHNVAHRAHYAGMTESGNVIYDTTKPFPVLMFQGTVKLHGTNAAVATDADGNMWCQSRDNIITPEKDNAGFAMFVERHRETFRNAFGLCTISGLDETTFHNDILIFGEWCGGSIQKTVALNQLPKMFVVFGIALVDVEENRRWVPADVVSRICSEAFANLPDVKCIYDFQTWEMEIDFARPHDAQNPLSELTLQVEAECPVGKALGAIPEKGSIIGEGIVWKCVTPGYSSSKYWFKVKGDEHSKGSKVKTLAQVDVERIDNINKLAEAVTPKWRLDQMLQQTFDTLNGGTLDIKRTGEYIKNVMQDIIKEELDVLAASGFTTKDITGAVSKIAREHLMTQLDAEAGL